MTLRAPFPWFGGKSRVAHLVWDRFGDVPNMVDPFCGSLAVLLARPHTPGSETVNDVDCFVANVWRALAADPELVASYADWPVNEADLHARHLWLVNQLEFRERMKTDPDFFDAKIAGWWLWGVAQWIGTGWCQRPEWRGRGGIGDARGVHAKRPNIDKGRGVARKLPLMVSQRGGVGVHVWRPPVQLPVLMPGAGVHSSRAALLEWFAALQARLRRVRVCCGDWKRILGPSPTVHIGTTGVFLDPPYDPDAIGDGSEHSRFYAEQSAGISGEVRKWAIEHGDDPQLRIALCGYEGEHEMPDSWTCVAWSAAGGYSNRGENAGKNRGRERIWFSKHCLRVDRRAPLFEEHPDEASLL